MATTYWNPNGQAIAQVDTLTVAAVANGGTLTVTINAKSITYTCTSTDTTSTAAAGLLTLLQATTVPAEFAEITWANSTAVVTATATTPGTPFTITVSSGGGATLNQVHTTANSSPSDVNNANNWSRNGAASLPQSGDDVVIANTSVGLLWNLDQLATVQFNSYTRYQSFTGTIGLPDFNPNGYVEYRPTYFQFKGTSAVSALPMTLGLGTGSGPSRERYNVGTQITYLNVVASGSAADAFAVRFLGTNAANTAAILGTSVGVAYWPGETSTLASATVDGGGSLTLGSGTTFSGTLTVTNGTANLYCTVGALSALNSSTVTVTTLGTQVSGAVATIATVTATGQSTVVWNSNATITTLTLTTNSTLDKSQDARAMTITNSTIDGDTCQVLDPLSAITWTNATTVKNLVSSGPFTFLGTRTVKIT